MKVVVVGGGIAGLAAARRLEALLPDADITIVERERRLGGKLITERVDGFIVEGAADSFLSRKERGIGLVEELGLEHELIGRRTENPRSFVRLGDELHPMPEGLTGMVPTNLDALASSALLSAEGRARLAAEVDLPPMPADGDESIAQFACRRLGPEAYERLVEPLVTGIYGGDGEYLSVDATFPELRKLELEHGSVIRGLLAQAKGASSRPPFVSLRSGMDTLVTSLLARLERTNLRASVAARALKSRAGSGFTVELDNNATLEADGVVVAIPAYAAAPFLAEIDRDLANAHAEIPYASAAVVTLAYNEGDLAHPLDGYGYVIPRREGSDVLACTWSSSKWEGRAPEGYALLRVYAGRFGGRDLTQVDKDDLLQIARGEVRFLGIEGEPHDVWIHRWRYGMPQYVLGHPERVARIEAALARHPGLALAGAAYRGVGIPDCIRSGEEAAESIARSLAGVTG